VSPFIYEKKNGGCIENESEARWAGGIANSLRTRDRNVARSRDRSRPMGFTDSYLRYDIHASTGCASSICHLTSWLLPQCQLFLINDIVYMCQICWARFVCVTLSAYWITRDCLGSISIVAYIRRPFANTDELQQTIENVYVEIRGDPDFLDKLSSASRAFRHRLEHCIAIGGRQVESGRFWSTDNLWC
jgi:hypothetical protein